jgi:hypothetical protein
MMGHRIRRAGGQRPRSEPEYVWLSRRIGQRDISVLSSEFAKATRRLVVEPAAQTSSHPLAGR